MHENCILKSLTGNIPFVKDVMVQNYAIVCGEKAGNGKLGMRGEVNFDIYDDLVLF